MVWNCQKCGIACIEVDGNPLNYTDWTGTPSLVRVSRYRCPGCGALQAVPPERAFIQRSERYES